MMQFYAVSADDSILFLNNTVMPSIDLKNVNCSKYRGECHVTNLQMTFCIFPGYTNHISWEFTFSQIPEMTIFSFGAGVLGSALNVIS